MKRHLHADGGGYVGSGGKEEGAEDRLAGVCPSCPLHPRQTPTPYIWEGKSGLCWSRALAGWVQRVSTTGPCQDAPCSCLAPGTVPARKPLAQQTRMRHHLPSVPASLCLPAPWGQRGVRRSWGVSGAGATRRAERRGPREGTQRGIAQSPEQSDTPPSPLRRGSRIWPSPSHARQQR